MTPGTAGAGAAAAAGAAFAGGALAAAGTAGAASGAAAISFSTCFGSSRAICGGLPTALTAGPSKGSNPASQQEGRAWPKAAARPSAKRGITGQSRVAMPRSALPTVKSSARLAALDGSSQGLASCSRLLQRSATWLASRITSRSSSAR